MDKQERSDIASALSAAAKKAVTGAAMVSSDTAAVSKDDAAVWPCAAPSSPGAAEKAVTGLAPASGKAVTGLAPASGKAVTGLASASGHARSAPFLRRHALPALFPLRNVLAAAALAAVCLLSAACTRYEPVALEPGYNEDEVPEALSIDINVENTALTGNADTAEEETDAGHTARPVRAKGIYLASNPLANSEFVDELLYYIDSTELNAVVIDVKDDYGRITYDMQGVPIINELGTVEADIPDMPGIMARLKEHDVYTIARIVSMRDPYISTVRPEWCLTDADGELYTDSSGYTWANPYNNEYWNYLLAIARQCAVDGFDEIQFDYIRFSTDSGADKCITDEEETKGRDKISIITEAVGYLTEGLSAYGVYVSCDVFGTIIGSQIDSRAVGQDYPQLAAIVDYMSPMIYPSHYARDNFGLDVPDLHPYEAISGALGMSRMALDDAAAEGERQAVVRPWLQAFTATWLGEGNYLIYDADAIRSEIQAVYDSGYDEWILWSASASYDYNTFLSNEEEAAEDAAIEEARNEERQARMDEENVTRELPSELADALDGDDLYPEDREFLEQDGPVITYE